MVCSSISKYTYIGSTENQRGEHRLVGLDQVAAGDFGAAGHAADGRAQVVKSTSSLAARSVASAAARAAWACACWAMTWS